MCASPRPCEQRLSLPCATRRLHSSSNSAWCLFLASPLKTDGWEREPPLVIAVVSCESNRWLLTQRHKPRVVKFQFFFQRPLRLYFVRLHPPYTFSEYKRNRLLLLFNMSLSALCDRRCILYISFQVISFVSAKVQSEAWIQTQAWHALLRAPATDVNEVLEFGFCWLFKATSPHIYKENKMI